MSTTVFTFLFELANFIVLAGALGWFFFKPVRQALASRRDRLLAEEQLAVQHREEAEKIRNEMAAARKQLQGELDAQRARDIESARKQAEAILADARSVAEREIWSGQQKADQLLKSREDGLGAAAARAAAVTLERLMKEIDGPPLQSALIRSAIKQLQQWSPQRLAPVKVESARALDTRDRALLDTSFGDSAATADYRVSEDLGVGIRISTASGMIDASATGLAAFAEQSLIHALRKKTGLNSSAQGSTHE